MDRFYIFSLILRFALVLIPQYGYIHPDEFFQSLEIVSGDMLELEISKPWEFNVSAPIRCIVPPYLTIGSGLKILKILNNFTKQFDINLINSYTLLVFTRLVFCILSLLIDLSLYNILRLDKLKSERKLYLLSTSYIILIYSTHTFSNSIEMVLFSLLLYYVSDSIILSNIIHEQLDYLNKEYAKATTATQRARLHKLRMFIPYKTFHHCFKISTISAIGFFNRPTFTFFAIGPIFLWCYRGAGYKSFSLMKIQYRMTMFILSALPTTFLLIIIDSFYYGHISWGEIGLFRISLNNFVVTPYNFIMYNINNTNLQLHGKHPLYTHSLVNIPLLFNILGIGVLVYLINLSKLFIEQKYNHLPRLITIKGLMTISCLLPVFGLSLFEHQEPRFLIPLLIPMVYLGSDILSPNANDSILNYKSIENCNKSPNRFSKFLLKLWYLLNVICLIIYGFVHQGGVVPLSSYLSNEISLNPNVNYHVVTAYTYSIPKAFMLVKKSPIFFDRSERVMLYEKGSLDIDKLQDFINILTQTKRTEDKFFLVIPGSLREQLDVRSIRLKLYTQFFPHLSTESLSISNFDYVFHNPILMTIELRNLLTLYVYEIE